MGIENMKIEFDFKKIINEKINSEMMKEKEAAPIVKVLNKHGIYGVDAMAFIMELGEAVKEINEKKE